MKSSSDGPSDNVVAKVVFFNAVGLDVAGVAKERICLVTEVRTRHEWVRMRDIVSRRVLGANALPKQDLAHRVRSRGPLSLSPPSMSTLSRREEDTLFKATKANALRECDGLVKGSFMVICLIPGSHLLHSICRVRRRTYRFSRLGLQGEVQGRSGLRLSVVRIMFHPYTLLAHVLPVHDQRACSLCGTNTSDCAMNKRNNYHHSSFVEHEGP
jgi:hypothetical protein